MAKQCKRTIALASMLAGLLLTVLLAVLPVSAVASLALFLSCRVCVCVCVCVCVLHKLMQDGAGRVLVATKASASGWMLDVRPAVCHQAAVALFRAARRVLERFILTLLLSLSRATQTVLVRGVGGGGGGATRGD